MSESVILQGDCLNMDMLSGYKLLSVSSGTS